MDVEYSLTNSDYVGEMEEEDDDSGYTGTFSSHTALGWALVGLLVPVGLAALVLNSLVIVSVKMNAALRSPLDLLLASLAVVPSKWPEAFGMVGKRHKVQRLIQCNGLPSDDCGRFSFGNAVGGIGVEAGTEKIGVERQARMHVQIAEIHVSIGVCAL